MNTYKRTGFFNEGIMQTLLTAAGFTDRRGAYDTKELIAVADRLRPGRTANVASKIGNFKGWANYPAAYIIDRVYGIDGIILLPPNGDSIAFDFCTDPHEVEAKVQKLIAFAPMWEALGISKACVLLAVYPSGKDQGSVFYDTDAAVDDLFEIIFSVAESASSVCERTLSIRYK